jgi:hypothetical protein
MKVIKYADTIVSTDYTLNNVIYTLPFFTPYGREKATFRDLFGVQIMFEISENYRHQKRCYGRGTNTEWLAAVN